MFNYLAFLDSGIDKAGADPSADGKALANQCLAKLGTIDNQEQFPPKLLVLLVSASYLGGDNTLDDVRARKLIGGIHWAFSEAGYPEIQLIGSTVAAVFFEDRIHPNGALLVCLASKLLDVVVAVGTNVSLGAQRAVKSLLDGLNIGDNLEEYPRPLPNRTLLTFFPGSGEAGPATRHSTDKLHALLLEKLTNRIPIVGGVSSADDPNRKKRGLQFVNRQPFSDALAACLLFSGPPLATSLAKGIEPIGEIVHVKSLSEDGTKINEFYEGKPEEIFRRINHEYFEDERMPILLKDLSPGNDFVRGKCLPESGYSIVEVLREVREHAALEVATPTPRKMYDETRKAHQLSLERANMTHPVGCLSFKCTGHLDYSKPLKLNLESGIIAMKKRFGIECYVGGFFDGEAGTDEGGTSLCRGWSVGALIFGDQISERTAVVAGFDSLIKHGAKLAGTFELDEDLDQSLGLILDLGFPGAMLSILMPDMEDMRFVPVKAKGSRFEKLWKAKRRSGEYDDLPFEVERDNKPHFVVASKSDFDAGQKSNVVIPSQYVLPLFDPDGEVFALLRVDLGDPKGATKIEASIARILEPIAAIVGAAINRIFGWEENRIGRKLDRTLNNSLSKTSLDEALQTFLEGTLRAFSLKMGHIRIFNNESNTLDLRAGVGSYFKIAQNSRVSPDTGDWSPSVQAFTESRIIIINDAQHNDAHLALRRRYDEDQAMGEALDKIGSYANIPFRTTEDKIGQISLMGTIGFQSEEPWKFIGYHERAMAVLRRRMIHLLEDFLNKESEAKAHRESQELGKRLKYLQSVSPKLYGIGHFHDFKSLVDLTRNFAEGMGADCASLFIWDDNYEQYVLRAAYGWQSDWVNAARYEKDSTWIGNLPVYRPLYVHDLHRYYLDRKYPEPEGRYAQEMFGRKLTNLFCVDAWSIPLLVSGKRLGVLILYLTTNPAWALESQPRRFAINDISLLQEAANQIAGLVKLLLLHQTIAFEQISQGRHKEIYSVFSTGSEGVRFEAAVCQKVCEILGASQVDFYTLKDLASSADVFWTYGCAGPDLDFPATSEPQTVPREITNTALRNRLKPFPFEAPALRKDPKFAAKQGLLERVCIPLLTAGAVIGVLDVRWDIDHLGDASLVGERGCQRLAEIGQMIGSAYWRRRLTLEQAQVSADAERSRKVVSAVGAIVLQTAHQFSNLTQKIYGLYLDVREAENDQERTDYLDILSEVVREAMTRISWPMDTAKRLQQLSRERCPLRALIKQSLDEAEESEFVPSPTINSEDVEVMVNPEHAKQALINIVNNAFRAIRDKQGGDLTISAYRIPNTDRVQIEIKDTGVGMANEEKEKALSGLLSTEGRPGVGLLISSTLLHLQGGNLDLKDTVGGGLTVIVTLPLAE